MKTGQKKTQRQAIACEWCRSHKLKCDCEQPSCRNCFKRGVACITTNLRKPGTDARRQPPVGRRHRGSVGTSSGIVSCNASPSASDSRNPPRRPVEAERLLEPQTSGSVLPAIFSTPFDSDSESAEDVHGNATSSSLPGHHRGRVGSTPPLIMDAGGAAPRSQILGNASSRHVLVQWLDLYFRQNRDWQPVFPLFELGLAHSAELPLPFMTSLPLLPSAAQMAQYESVFFAKIYPIFPVLHRQGFHLALVVLRRTMECDPTGAALRPADYPLLACAYAVASLTADEEAGRISTEGTRYLEAGYSLYAHLVAAPYFSSVQALLLLTLALRNRNKDTASWGSLGQAIRIAQAVGLHRQAALLMHIDRTAEASGLTASETENQNVHARVWWTAYMLERTMELETGRPSAIQDDECDQNVPPVDAPGASFAYFSALVSLAKIKTRAVNLLFNGKRQRKPVKELLFELGQIDRALLDWADAFPESIRPGRDIVCSPSELPLATYVALQFHLTMISLHRPALVSELGFLRNRINEYCTGTPWKDRLHFSLCIGAAAARGILKAVNDLMMYARLSRMITADQILLAVLVLEIYVTKVPGSRLNRSDLALADTFGELVEEEYVRSGHGPDFIRGISLLRKQMADYLARPNSSPETVPRAGVDSCQPELETVADTVLERFNFGTDFAQLEESWSHLWNEDIESLLLHHTEQDTTSMYLLGIPQSWP